MNQSVLQRDHRVLKLTSSHFRIITMKLIYGKNDIHNMIFYFHLFALEIGFRKKYLKTQSATSILGTFVFKAILGSLRGFYRSRSQTIMVTIHIFRLSSSYLTSYGDIFELSVFFYVWRYHFVSLNQSSSSAILLFSLHATLWSIVIGIFVISEVDLTGLDMCQVYILNKLPRNSCGSYRTCYPHVIISQKIMLGQKEIESVSLVGPCTRWKPLRDIHADFGLKSQLVYVCLVHLSKVLLTSIVVLIDCFKPTDIVVRVRYYVDIEFICCAQIA